jgi:uncharacterized membrane protein
VTCFIVLCCVGFGDLNCRCNHGMVGGFIGRWVVIPLILGGVMICCVFFLIGMAKSVIMLSDTICWHFFNGERCIYSPRGCTSSGNFKRQIR